MTENRCPGASVVLSTRTDTLPPCVGLSELIAAGKPLAVVSTVPRAGAAAEAFSELDEIAAGAGRPVLLVAPKVAVEDADSDDWRATLHLRPVRSLLNADAIERTCSTGVVAVCGMDSVYAVDSRGRVSANVEPESLLAAVASAVGTSTNVCSRSCPQFREE
jgi:hypothetical protein